MKKKMTLFLAILVGIPLFYILGNILWAYITYYRPNDIEIIQTNLNTTALDSTEFSAIIWNVGYGGLGAEADFFYDGGKMVRPTKALAQKYQKGIEDWVSKVNADFILLQEVDSYSRRSYFYPQADRLRQLNSSLYSSYALNYSVRFVPQPWLEPMGKVNSGLLTLSRYASKKSERHQLPGAFGFPKQLYFLRRCLLIDRFPLKNGKELVIVNVHNSAYDDSGKLKRQEMDYLKSFLEQEYQKENYIVCGGDWNQCPPGFDYRSLAKGKEGDYFQTNVDSKFMNQWKWHFDPSTPTNRKNDRPYSSNTFVTLIDFFLVSPNIEVLETKAIDQNFEFSDHQPVKISFRIK